MFFQFLKLIIWPKNRQFPPQIIEFKLGMVNVITGGSRSGKSAIIPIIDYCLASSECQIPIDTIRDNAAWYGVHVQSGHEQLLIARKEPNGREPSDEFYLARGAEVSIPPFIDFSNQRQDSIKHLLNSISGVPYFKLNGSEDPRGFQERLSFRDLMALVFQSQDVVANQNILFYKTHAYEHRERLKNWIPFIFEAETVEVLEARQRLGVVQYRLNLLRKEAAKAGKVSSAWLSNMHGHLQLAKGYGILDENYILPNQPTELLEVAKSIIGASRNAAVPTPIQVDRASADVLLLENEDVKISDEISLIRKRLYDLQRLRSGLVEYGGSTQRRADRLHISQWIKSIGSEGHSCPLCGEDEHKNSSREVEKISAAFEEVEDTANKTSEVPSSFAREEATLKNQLDGVLTRKKNLNSRLDVILARNKTAKEQFDRRQSLHFYLGHLQASLETFESLTEKGSFGEKIVTLEDEERKLLEIVDPAGVSRRLKAAISQIAQKALARLKTLDAEEKYKRTPPDFSVKDLALRVLSNDGHWHFLSEVGSASNWLSFHIAFICGLHEYFSGQRSSCVPSFTIFDQPSQVYFPRTALPTRSNDSQISDEEEKENRYANEDIYAVKSIFNTLADSVKAQNGKWQCLVLDHAGDEIYGGIEKVHEVDVWRDGRKLIPKEWYQ